jgi:hypothetical protein
VPKTACSDEVSRFNDNPALSAPSFLHEASFKREDGFAYAFLFGRQIEHR